MNAIGERRNVAKAEVEAETRQRMQHMGGVADQRQPAAGEGLGHIHGERIAVAARNQLHISQMRAEAQLQLLLEGLERQGQHALSRFLAFRPDEGGPVAGQRQDGEGP